MSLMRAKSLTVALCPDAVGVVLRESRAQPRREYFDVVAEDGASWRGALDGLAQWLTRNNHERGRASVVVSSRFVRYALVPWPSTELKRDEGSVWARFHLETVHGDMTGWTVACDTGEFGRARVACAMPDAFLHALRETLTTRKISADAIRPAFVNGWNGWRKLVKPGRFFGVAESDRLVLGCCGQRGWESLRVLSAKGSCDELIALVRREHVLMGKTGTPNALLFAPGTASVPSGTVANAGDGIHWLQPDEIWSAPALAMANLAAER